MVKTVKRKKNTRQRAATTHGWGSMKKHRGAGHRGGRGRAGSGKRGDAKKPSYWKNMQEGKHGFTSKRQFDPTRLNVGHLCSSLLTLVEQGKVENKSGTFVVDLTKLGIDKLLGAGITDRKMEVTVNFASTKAVEKIEKAGGKVIIPEASTKKAALKAEAKAKLKAKLKAKDN